MSLKSLPHEILALAAFHLIAQNPLGPPHQLIPLALTCRFFKNIVTSKQFLARICRLKFDIAPIKRRCFIPRDRDLADELIRCCQIMQDIRNVDFTDPDSFVDDTLVSAYILMLNNDGKNYAQLEYAGIDAYVDKFVRTKLWEGRQFNQGWPLSDGDSDAALWLMWMTLTKQKLLAESPAAREEMILLTLPYVVLPHRYPSALAPPNHFNLPLDSQNPYHQRPLITTLSPSTPYPIYINQYTSIPYFNARIHISRPLITVAAKLLFVARKELFPLRAPPHFPPAPGEGITGITQQDFREFNSHPAAKLCRLVRWDWDAGRPRCVGEDDQEIGEGWEESKVWDTEWWRRLSCYSCGLQTPKYPPGDVYKLGSMKGSWQGREYLPHGNLFLHFLHHPDVDYPGIPDEHRPHLFTEASIGLSMKPVFLEIQEHHKICECPLEDSHSYTTAPTSFTPNSRPNPSSSSLPVEAQTQTGRCGVVPVPAPLMFVSIREQAGGDIQFDDDPPLASASDALTLSLPHQSDIKIIDYSMSNAWFPGHVGGVSFAKLPTTGDKKKNLRDKIVCAVDFQTPDVRSVLMRPEESECLAMGGSRRVGGGRGEKMNAFVYETYEPERVSGHRGLETCAGGDGDGDANVNTSDPDKCPRCLQREVLIRQERRKAEERSRRMLDRGMRSYGLDWEEYDDEEEEEEEEEGEYEEEDEGMDEGTQQLEDMDVSGLDIDLEGIDQLIADAPPPPHSPHPHPHMHSRLTTFGDDLPNGEPGAGHVDFEVDQGTNANANAMDDEQQQQQQPQFGVGVGFGRTRRVYDKCRIGVECSGVGDVLLSGETGPRHAVWQSYRMYGRIRPWDGLIGILRSANTPNTTNNIFIYGYIVGEHNFVGEWRVAASDPLRPTWGGAFVMSRRGEGGRAENGGGGGGA